MTKTIFKATAELKQLAQLVQQNLLEIETVYQKSDEDITRDDIKSYLVLIEAYNRAANTLIDNWQIQNAIDFTNFFDKLPVYASYLSNYLAKKDSRALYKLQVIEKGLQTAYQATLD